MKNRRINITDLTLTNDKHILEVQLSYNEGGMNYFTGERSGRGIYLSVSPIEKSNGCRSFMIGGGPKGFRHCLESSERFNAKRLAAIASDIQTGEFAETYQAIVLAVLKANDYVLASDASEAYKPIELVLGQRVSLTSGRDHSRLFGYVVKVNKPTQFASQPRYDVLCDDGMMFLYKRPDDTIQPITPVDGASIAPQSIIDGLLANYQTAQDQKDAERLAVVEAKKVETSDCLTALKAKYPWAKQDGSSHARASYNLKQELQLTFPGVSFTVKSNSFSMGDSVRVGWTNGPTTNQVKAISDKYQYGHFDGMNDSYNYNQSAESDAVSTWLGQSKYVSENRHYSPGLFERVESDIAGQYAEGSGPNRQEAYQALERVQITGEYTGVELIDNHWEPQFTVAEHSQIIASLVTEGVVVSENPDKGGIEIRFNSKPEPETLATVRANGFRWSKFQKLWYAKANDRTRSFASGLVAAPSNA